MTNDEAIEIIECGDISNRWGKDGEEVEKMAIKALKQEPCKDAISRKAVLDGLANIAKEKARSDAQKALMGRVMFFTEKLPPVNPQKPICPSAGIDCEDCPAYEPKTGWIPVSERLPNFAGTYLVTRYFPNNVMNPTYLVDACFFDGTDTWHNDNRINHERKYLTNVVAWLEEPEPYKAEGSEE